MNTITEETAYSESMEYFDGDELAATTWINKYAMKDSSGNLLESNPKMMHDRLINAILEKENNYDKKVLTRSILEELLYKFKYVIPGGSVMSGLGNPYKFTSLSNCFVIKPPVDSYGGIMKADQELVQLCKRRGGVGTDLSNLRPGGAIVTNDAKTSSGVVSFMDRYSNSVREVGQNGRRGALMLTISIIHPDSEAFIDAKLELNKVTGANISVKITNEFMNAVKTKSPYLQRFPISSTKKDLGIDETSELDKDYKVGKLYLGQKPGTYFRVINARSLWNKIIKNNTKSAEPGVLFIDTIQSESPADIYKDKGFETVSTNPCFTGDTLIATADGRNAVPIKLLAEENKQFPVYCARVNESHGDKSGGWVTEVSTATAFKTGTKEIIEVTLSDGSSFKCTKDHRLALPDGTYIEAKDSLGLTLSKFFSLYKSVGYGTKYRFINSVSCYKQYSYIASYYGLWEEGKVIHHKDGDSSNDCIDNLELIDPSEHQSNHMKEITQWFK